MGLIGKLFGIDRRAQKMASACLPWVKTGLNLYLTSELEREFDFQYAVALAGAVETTVFTEEPWNESGREFLASEMNRLRVQRAIEKLIQPHESLRRLITDTVHIKCIRGCGDSKGRSESELRRVSRESLEALRQHGILVSGGDPPRLSVFVENAKTFAGVGGPDFPYREN